MLVNIPSIVIANRSNAGEFSLLLKEDYVLLSSFLTLLGKNGGSRENRIDNMTKLAVKLIAHKLRIEYNESSKNLLYRIIRTITINMPPNFISTDLGLEIIEGTYINVINNLGNSKSLRRFAVHKPSKQICSLINHVHNFPYSIAYGNLYNVNLAFEEAPSNITSKVFGINYTYDTYTMVSIIGCREFIPGTNNFASLHSSYLIPRILLLPVIKKDVVKEYFTRNEKIEPKDDNIEVEYFADSILLERLQSLFSSPVKRFMQIYESDEPISIVDNIIKTLFYYDDFSSLRSRRGLENVLQRKAIGIITRKIESV